MTMSIGDESIVTTTWYPKLNYKYEKSHKTGWYDNLIPYMNGNISSFLIKKYWTFIDRV